MGVQTCALPISMMGLVTNIAETGQRVGGTAGLAVGEGRQDAPVGTTLALIDQATKILNSVHKRLHAAQAKEFQLLVRCFREHPKSFWQQCRKQTIKWNEQLFIQALNDCELVPQADPNTSSHTQRVMKVMALKQLAAANPALYDPVAVDTAALKAIGWSNPEQFMSPAEARAQMPPEAMAKIEELKIKKQDADARMMTAQANAAKVQADIGAGQDGAPQMDPNKMIDAELKRMEMQQKAAELQMKREEIDAELKRVQMEMQMRRAEDASRLREDMFVRETDQLENWNRRKDRESDERIAAVRLAQDLMKAPDSERLMGKIIDDKTLGLLKSEEPAPPGFGG